MPPRGQPNTSKIYPTVFFFYFSYPLMYYFGSRNKGVNIGWFFPEVLDNDFNLHVGSMSCFKFWVSIPNLEHRQPYENPRFVGVPSHSPTPKSKLAPLSRSPQPLVPLRQTDAAHPQCPGRQGGVHWQPRFRPWHRTSGREGAREVPRFRASVWWSTPGDCIVLALWSFFMAARICVLVSVLHQSEDDSAV